LFYSFSRFGRDAEYLVGLYLKSNDWNVYFSKGSRGPSDIVAIKNEMIWLIQIKSSTKIPKIHGYEIQNLIKLSDKIDNSFPVLSLVSPNISCNAHANSVSSGDYLLNFYLLPDWKNIPLS
jgi:Holliday junction resolvase